jgi:hypothetical protein
MAHFQAWFHKKQPKNPVLLILISKTPIQQKARQLTLPGLLFPKIKLTYIYAVTGSREEPFGLKAGWLAIFSIKSAMRLE